MQSATDCEYRLVDAHAFTGYERQNRRGFSPTPQDHYLGDGLPIQQRICATRVNERYDIFYYIFEPVRFDEPPPWYCPGCIHLVTTRYFIRNKVTRQCVDARDGAKNDWSIVSAIWSCRDKSAPQNARSMVWDSVPGDFYSDGIHSLGITGRSFKLKNFNSGLCLDVRSGSSDEFAQLQQYHCTSNNPAQNFYQAGDPY